jgi:hypothetical protein
VTATLPCTAPLSVGLTSFTATKVAGGTKLAWDTSSELSITGYNILRSATGKRADATRITTTPIAATGDGVTGGSYTFTDLSSAVLGNYTYWLEVLNTDGTTHEYPVTPTLTNTYKAYMPLAIR